MKFDQLKLGNGKWLVANCGKSPSEKNCKLVMMAPHNQREDLLDALEEHVIESHGHKKSEKIRGQLGEFLETIEI